MLLIRDVYLSYFECKRECKYYKKMYLEILKQILFNYFLNTFNLFEIFNLLRRELNILEDFNSSTFYCTCIFYTSITV